MNQKFTANARLTFSGIATIVACLFISARVQAMNQYTYDLDSLVYMSPQIAEGTLGSEYSTNNVTVSDFKISAVHKGSFKAGQTIQLTALDFYSVAEKGFWNERKLKNGDQFFFFGDRAEETYVYHIPYDAEIYWPAPSGMWLIFGGKALDSWQFNNPGPYVTVLEGAATNTSILTIDELRKRIHESMNRVEKWRPVLESATTKDIPTLLEILHTRTNAPEWGRRDMIAEIVCKRLADLHNIDALVKVSRQTNSWWSNVSLGQGFGTPDGREFLLTNILNKELPTVERRKYASLLADAGEVYFSTNNGPVWTSEQRAGINSNNHYLKRLAQIAAFNDLDPEIRLDLIKFFQRVPYSFDKDIPSVIEDVKDAETVLKWFLAKTTSEDLKYELERALIINRDEDQLSPDLPTIASILKPRDPSDNFHPPSGQLGFSYDYLIVREGSWTPRIAFVDVKTGRKSIAEWPGDSIKGLMGGGGSATSLPKNLSHGHYRIFLEFLENGKVIATSHYFEADL